MVTVATRSAAETRLADTAVLVIKLPAMWRVTDESFFELLELNEELQFEVDEEGRLVVMGSGGFLSSARAVIVSAQISIWSAAGGGGMVSGEGGFFRTRGSGRRAPDVAWISAERAAAAIAGDEGAGMVCPDFLVEVLSPSDQLPLLQSKMRMWLEEGVRLAWLLDPFGNAAYVYRPGGEPERHERPASLSGEDVLPGLVVDLSSVWRAE